MAKTVIFVGYVRQSYLDYFLAQNYTIGLFADPNRTHFIEKFEPDAEKKIDFIFPIDFTSKKSIEQSLKRVVFKRNVLLVCLNDRYLLGTSYIANILDLDQKANLPVNLAKNGTDKMYQRRVFKSNYPEITPEYKKIRTFHGAYLFVRKYGFPVIIKPANLSQSQLVNVCENLEDLISKVSYVLDHVSEVYKKNQVHSTPVVGIEQYIKGKQYSVDSYVSLDGKIIHTPICEQVIGYDAGRNNFETLYSSYSDSLSTEECEIIFDTVSKAIKALDIKGNPTHTEVRLTPEGECKVVEVNIRTGGFRATMLKYSYEFSHPQNVINTYLGKPIEVNFDLKSHSSCPQFWSETEGYLKAVHGIEEVKKLPSFKKIAVSIDEGESVGPADLGYPKVVYTILSHPDKKVLQKDLKKVREIIKFEVEEIQRPSQEEDEEEY